MNFISLDLRIGLSGNHNISANRIAFHSSVAQLLLNLSEMPSRLGIELSTAIDYRHYVKEPKIVSDSLISALRSLSGGAPDLCVVDLTSNPFVLVRDPILFALIDGVEHAVNEQLCRQFAILLRELPGEHLPSITHLSNLPALQNTNDSSVTLLADSGRRYSVPGQSYSLSGELSHYSELVRKSFGGPKAEVERKTVRRLGHFSRSGFLGMGDCRSFSFMMADCSRALLELLSDWWKTNNQAKIDILYDLKANEPFREAVKAFADRHSLNCLRVEDIISNDVSIMTQQKAEKYLLILDAVHTGDTLRNYITELGSKGISLNKTILSAINRTGTTDSQIDEYNVHGFLSKPPEMSPKCCPQCSLELPITPESHEEFAKIRSYDFLYMVQQFGWEPEPSDEVPAAIGHQLPNVPKFSLILGEYGDWIAYKIHLFLRKFANVPDDWFVIHPDETDSTQLCEKLQLYLDNRLNIVRVKRPLLEVALKGEQWGDILLNSDASQLKADLKAVNGAGALVLDVFNASGSTRQSLVDLLKTVGITPFAYICFVEFGSELQPSMPGSLPMFSLYDWYNPRILK